MIPILHENIKDIPAAGSFSFITLHTRTGARIAWTYDVKLKDFAGAHMFYYYYTGGF